MRGVGAVIRAAGGVVWRPGPSGVEICLVHRPRYGDWSLPKGKLGQAEHPLAAAVREVAEETGVRAAPQFPLPSAQYISGGSPKTVDFWAMRAMSPVDSAAGAGASGAESEVDEVRWLGVPAALALLSYPRDVEVVQAFAVLPPLTGTVVLVRHASAGGRDGRAGPDHARPLDGSGAARARELASSLALFAPELLVSASARRCVATLGPLASVADLPIEVDTTFDEGSDPATAAVTLCVLATISLSTVVCSQGGIIPATLRVLDGTQLDHRTAKGAAWLLAFTGSDLVGLLPLI